MKWLLWVELFAILLGSLVVSCRLCELWGCNVPPPSQPEIVSVRIPDIPCGGGKLVTEIGVTIDGGDNLTPSPQYCFVKIECTQPWCSAPQEFGSGTTILYFSGFPAYNENCEVIVGVTPDLIVANNCSVGEASKIQTSILPFAGSVSRKCPLIEYDCMAGYDIRGGPSTSKNDSLFNFAKSRFESGNTTLYFFEDATSLADTLFSTYDEFFTFIMTNWEQDFWLGNKEADFYLAGIKNCVNRSQFYGPNPGDSLSSAAVALSKKPNYEPFGVRGGSSTVFKQEIDSVLNAGSEQRGYNLTGVHEMGHTLAALTHPADSPNSHSGGAEANCVMNRWTHNQYGDIGTGLDKFCNKCKTNIQNIVWPSRQQFWGGEDVN